MRNAHTTILYEKESKWVFFSSGIRVTEVFPGVSIMDPAGDKTDKKMGLPRIDGLSRESKAVNEAD